VPDREQQSKPQLTAFAPPFNIEISSRSWLRMKRTKI
jgi:hypothetical protein